MKKTKITAMALAAVLLCGCNGKPAEETTTTTTVTTTSISVVISKFEVVDVPDEPEEHGTSAYVDYLALKAKADSSSATDDELQDAVDWLRANVDSCFDSQENMELTMYYGELLEYKYKKTGNEYEDLGWQAFKTVKYVYRNVETTSDEATITNYEKLKKKARNVSDIK